MPTAVSSRVSPVAIENVAGVTCRDRSSGVKSGLWTLPSPQAANTSAMQAPTHPLIPFIAFPKFPGLPCTGFFPEARGGTIPKNQPRLSRD